ncbi:MAG: hypothetical protein E7613_05300 [Ruminococcaceae bacterium]|nr:hypothetical protein [Oscillospiraceae bacterium]
MIKALRLTQNSYTDETLLKKYLDMVKNNIDVIDEITLFADKTHHGYTPFETTLKTAAKAKAAIEAYKKLGVKKVGLNVLATFGHTEDGSCVNKKADLQYMVNIEGQESGSCLCPTDDRFISYITQKYKTYAETGADYIWTDDDIRYNNHGIVKEFCFCPKCLGQYNERNKKSYTLEEIRANWKDNKELRDTWKENFSFSVCRAIKAIRRAISEIDPKIETGYMTGGFNAIYEWMDSSGAVKGRPGGGFYNDRVPIDIFAKSFWVQRELVNYPERIRDIQYEYESYNGRTLEKSFHISELETTLAVMSGCNGVLYNRSTMLGEAGFFDMLRGSKDKWDIIAKSSEGCGNLGIFCASALTGRQLSEISVPVTANLRNAVAAIVVGDEWEEFSDSEIKDILSKNVLTDGKGLSVLNRRGFRNNTCGEVKKTFTNGVTERFTQDTVNGEFKNITRAASMDIYYEGDAYLLKADEDSRIISQLMTGETELGESFVMGERQRNKIAVDGYLMPNQAQTASKRHQLINVFQWLSGNKLPIVIKKSIKVVPIVRGKNGIPECIMLCNAHFDATGSFDVEIKCEENFSFVSRDGKLVPAVQEVKNGVTYITIDNIERWDYILLVKD